MQLPLGQASLADHEHQVGFAAVQRYGIAVPLPQPVLHIRDRLAVFRSGRVEQIGAPREVYESPATSFVADFVGLSNLVEGASAVLLGGSPAAFTIRPEKIRILDPGDAAPPGACSIVGRIRDVVYLGSHTRTLVTIDGGAVLTVVEQSREEPPAARETVRGRGVRLAWRRDHNRRVQESR